MGFKVLAPLVAIAPGEKSSDLGDSNNGPRYFYDGAVIPDGYNDERCKQLADEGMLEKVTAAKAEPDADTVDAVLASVGDDKEKAAAAIEAEKAGKNRSTLLTKLDKVANPA